MKFYVCQYAIETISNKIYTFVDDCFLLQINDEKLYNKYFFTTSNCNQWGIDENIWNFLESKHTFICCKDPFGINIFELSNEDVMYMKLMGWFQ